MSKIKNDRDAKALFGYESSFGGTTERKMDGEQKEQELEGLSPLELINNIEDENTRKILLGIQERVTEQARMLDEARAQGLETRRGRPKKDNGKETRATFIVNEAKLEKLKEITYLERRFMKEVVDSAISDYIDKYEALHGEIKPIKRF